MESVHFLLEVEEHNVASLGESARVAKEKHIVTVYLSLSATQQVNLPDDILNNVC